ncbi:MAG: hypothetical protein ACR2LX_16250 [Jatrophihabitans sp.]
MRTRAACALSAILLAVLLTGCIIHVRLTGGRWLLSAVTVGGTVTVTPPRRFAAWLPSTSGTGAVLLVAVDGYKVTNGRHGVPTAQSLKVTPVRVGGTWLLSDVTSVGVR